jgi:hypothetical protein
MSPFSFDWLNRIDRTNYIKPTNFLEKCLVDASIGKAQWSGLASVFLSSQVFVGVDEKTYKDIVRQGAQNVDSIAIYKIPGESGKLTMPIYASQDRLFQALRITYFVRMTGRDALKASNGADVSLNYGLLPEVRWAADDVPALIATNENYPCQLNKK